MNLWLASIVALLIALPQAASAAQPDAVARARADFDAGRYGEAVRTLEPVAAENPKDATIHYWLGRARLETHDFRGAVEALAQSVAVSPDNADYRRWLARAQGEIADRERSFTAARRARQELEHAVRLDPSNLPARRDLMGFYLEAPWIIGGGEGKAKTQIDAIAALDAIAGHLARAAFWRHKKDGVRARAEYEAVFKAAPSTIQSYLEAAEFYERADDAAGLRVAIEHAEKIDPAEAQLLYFKGVLGILTKTNLDGAEAALRTYLERVPPRHDRPSAAATHEWLGRLYEALSQSEQAKAEYTTALGLQSDRDSARQRLRRLEPRKK
jgi:tetratricopeptide (TPR) repeat protein